MKKKLCVIFGGKSSEHEVSCKSAYNILKNLDEEKYEIIKFGITKQGATWLYEGDNESLLDGSWENHDCTACVISHCPKTEGRRDLRRLIVGAGSAGGRGCCLQSSYEAR